MMTLRVLGWCAATFATVSYLAGQSEGIYHVALSYGAPGKGPRTDFSPHGTQVQLVDLPDDARLPDGATRPARTGTLKVGPDEKSWIKILVTTDADHPQDLCRLYIDRNRNGDFEDDGPRLLANPSMNKKTKGWWSEFRNVELSIPYASGIVEPYMVTFWSVREGEEPPNMMRYSVFSWRSGRVTVEGVEALVAVMDADNNAVFNAKDEWSVLGASERDALTRVLSHTEARHANRLMFLPKGDGKELVLEFRELSPDGRSLTFAVVDRAVTKAQDRAPDDTLASERSRPRTSHPFQWIDADIQQALDAAKVSGRKVILDFWASWCGPCRLLDEWIWSDAEVAAVLNDGYVGVKVDVDLRKDLWSRYKASSLPGIIVLDSAGNEVQRFGYLSSKEMLARLKR